MAKVGLYMSKSIAELNKRAEVNNTKSSAAALIKSSKKIVDEAHKAYLDGDEERAYVLFMRYMNVYSAVKKSAEYRKDLKYVNSMFGNDVRKAVMAAETLSGSLKSRYEELHCAAVCDEVDDLPEPPQDSVSPGDGPASGGSRNGEGPVSGGSSNGPSALDNLNKEKKGRQPASNRTNDAEDTERSDVLTPQDLYKMLFQVDDCSDLLIIDVRPASEYAESRISYEAMVNLSEDHVKPGMTAKLLSEHVPPQHTGLFGQRHRYASIVLIDRDSPDLCSLDPSVSPLLAVKKGIQEYDNQQLRCTPLILQGGFSAFSKYYPSKTTGGEVKSAPSSDVNSATSKGTLASKKITFDKIDFSYNFDGEESPPLEKEPEPAKPAPAAALAARDTTNSSTSPDADFSSASVGSLSSQPVFSRNNKPPSLGSPASRLSNLSSAARPATAFSIERVTLPPSSSQSTVNPPTVNSGRGHSSQSSVNPPTANSGRGYKPSGVPANSSTESKPTSNSLPKPKHRSGTSSANISGFNVAGGMTGVGSERGDNVNSRSLHGNHDSQSADAPMPAVNRKLKPQPAAQRGAEFFSSGSDDNGSGSESGRVTPDFISVGKPTLSLKDKINNHSRVGTPKGSISPGHTHPSDESSTIPRSPRGSGASKNKFGTERKDIPRGGRHSGGNPGEAPGTYGKGTTAADRVRDYCNETGGRGVDGIDGGEHVDRALEKLRQENELEEVEREIQTKRNEEKLKRDLEDRQRAEAERLKKEKEIAARRAEEEQRIHREQLEREVRAKEEMKRKEEVERVLKRKAEEERVMKRKEEEERVQRRKEAEEETARLTLERQRAKEEKRKEEEEMARRNLEKRRAEEKLNVEQRVLEEQRREAERKAKLAEAQAKKPPMGPSGNRTISNEQLPTGWQSKRDAETGEKYYVNHATGHSQSEPPRLVSSHVPTATAAGTSSLTNGHSAQHPVDGQHGRSQTTSRASNQSQRAPQHPVTPAPLPRGATQPGASPQTRRGSSSSTYHEELNDGGPRKSRSNLKRTSSQPNLAALAGDAEENVFNSGFSNTPSVSRTSKPSFPAKPATPEPAPTPSFARQDSYRQAITSFPAERLRRLHPCRDGQQKRKGLIGLYNLGNTCYLNSTVQCLSNTGLLQIYFMQNIYQRDVNTSNREGTRGKLATEFAFLLSALWSNRYEYIAPNEFKSEVSRANPLFAGYKQQDAQELLAFLLDSLHEDLNRVTVKSKMPFDLDNFRGSDEEAGRKAWAAHKKDHDSAIVEMCQGQLKSTVTCNHCGRRSLKFDTFMTLPLEITDSARCTLDECFCDYLQEEHIDGFKCEGCRRTGRATKKLDIWKIPSVLIIFFKRFRSKMFSDDHFKLNNYINYPKSSLRMDHFTANREASTVPYSLYGVINHSGSLNSGHYTACCKNSGEWMKYNDEYVSPASSSDVNSSAAYVLFYSNVPVTSTSQY